MRKVPVRVSPASSSPASIDWAPLTPPTRSSACVLLPATSPWFARLHVRLKFEPRATDVALGVHFTLSTGPAAVTKPLCATARANASRSIAPPNVVSNAFTLMITSPSAVVAICSTFCSADSEEAIALPAVLKIERSRSWKLDVPSVMCRFQASVA